MIGWALLAAGIAGSAIIGWLLYQRSTAAFELSTNMIMLIVISIIAMMAVVMLK